MSDPDRPLSEQPETPDEISEPSPEPGYRFGRNSERDLAQVRMRR